MSYKGKTHTYFRQHITVVSLSKRFPRRYLDKLVFPVSYSNGKLNILRLDSESGKLVSGVAKAKDALRMCSNEIMEDLYYSAKGSYIENLWHNYNKSVYTLRRHTYKAEVFLSNYVCKMSEGTTYEDILRTISEDLGELVLPAKEQMYQNYHIWNLDCRNIILRYDGENVYWFDDNWVWKSAPLDSKERPRDVWSYICKDNICTKLWHMFETGVPCYALTQYKHTSTLNRRVFKGIPVYQYSFNLNMFCELEVGETREAIFEKAPKLKDCANPNTSEILLNCCGDYERLRERYFLYNFRIEAQDTSDSVEIGKQVIATAMVENSSREPAIRQIKEKASLIEKALSDYLDSNWDESFLPREMYKDKALVEIYNGSEVSLVLTVPDDVWDKLCDISDEIEADNKMSTLRLK